MLIHAGSLPKRAKASESKSKESESNCHTRTLALAGARSCKAQRAKFFPPAPPFSCAGGRCLPASHRFRDFSPTDALDARADCETHAPGSAHTLEHRFK